MKKALTPELIIQATSDYFGIPVETMRDLSNKERHVAYARHMVLYLASKELHISGAALAKNLGYKNHASFSYASKKVEGWLRYGKTRRDLTAIKENLK